ncbi:MAG: DNA gyrase subunit A, partial [Alphaproteobacteria bacterium]|nr:DNA gyrase subunit A [Alphaproteobacteria bacterium]
SGMSTREEDFVSEVFVASTHTPILFFSTAGMVYQMKVYRLPMGSPQARGKAMVNLLPLDEGETISTVMPLPEDEESWSQLNVMFATAGGNVRRNLLSDFVNIKSNGKIAMKLDEGDRLVNVRTCAKDHDVLLSTRLGMCIRFPVSDVRVFSGRTSTGVRGIRLAKDDGIISMTVLYHAEIDMEVRQDYLRAAAALRRSGDEDGEAEPTPAELSPTEFAELAEREEFILAVTENGFGKRSSAYEYRITKRGGKGIANIEMTDRNGPVVAAFPVEPTDQIMLVTDAGKLIRCPIDDVRIAGRKTQGVTLFRVDSDERVVSVARLREDGEDENGEDGNGGDGDENGGSPAGGEG